MIRFITIFFLLILNSAGHAQVKQMLKRADFTDQKINEQWVYAKFKEKQSSIIPNMSIQKLQHQEAKGPLSGLVRIQVPKGMDPIAFCNELRKNPNLMYADPIVTYQLLSVPSDPLIGNQYYLDKIQAYDAWDITKGDDDITIGIIDSGIDLDHEDIVNNLWLNTADPIDGIDNDNNGYVDDYYGYDFADEDTDPSIQNGNHGMIVTGIASAAANNGKGIAGVGYNTKVAALKGFMSSNGLSGGLYEAITYAAENGIEVLNLSWGRMGFPLQSEQDIINDAVLNHDVIVVAAAGNEGGKTTEENKWYPASYEHVLSVGASDVNDNKSSGSSFNFAVDLIAPGVSTYSTVNNNGYTTAGPGTSFATPQVAAAAALVKDVFPNLSAIQIMERVRATADDIYSVGSNENYNGKLGKGRLNVYRAVSESGVKSLRASDASISSSYGDVAFYGDTVRVAATLTNYLSAVNDPSLIISSPDNYFSISEGTFYPGYMGTMESKEIFFEVILDESLAPETTVDLRMDFAETGYTDFQFLTVTTSPDYADFGNAQLSMTIGGDGDLGFNAYGPDFEGSGLIYQLDTLMTYVGIMLATNGSNVSDNIVSNYSSQIRNEDFQVQQFYKIYHHPAADYFGYSEFTDSNLPLVIEQSNITWQDEDYLIIRYRIVNNSGFAVSNLSFGVFADWDLDDETSNYAAYDATNDYIYTQNSGGDLLAGIKVLGGDHSEFSALDMGAFNGNTQDINNLFSDSDKYDFLVNQLNTTAGSVGTGNDVATINGVTIDQVDAYGEAYVNVIYALSDSKINLDAEFTSAESRLALFLQKPRVLQTFYTCDGIISINPADGTNYDFFEDPLAQDFISSGSSITPAQLTKDTLFYAKNMDNNYPSDVFEIRVKLLSEIADFNMSADTLYLDFPTNVVQFTDQSLDAVSWSWDFDQGTTTSLQNPLLSFSQTGTYSISLTIENTEGCIDTIVKDLVVADRPDAPSLDDLIVCPGDDVLLNDPTADKLNIYRFEDQIEPTASGTSPEISEILYDTIVYVSGVYGSFESLKTPLSIDVMEVSGSFEVMPDTTSSAYQLLLFTQNIETGSTLKWYVDGSMMSTSGSITIPAIESDVDISLEITSLEGCIKTIDRTVPISTSSYASHPDLTVCPDQQVIVRPENGSYFGFYEDPDLTQLIKKGTVLNSNQYSKVYVVGLDDGLPGLPIEVNIDEESVDLSIAHTSEPVGTRYKVNLFAVTNNVISSYQWYINGELVENVNNPTFFLNEESYEVVLVIETDSGCSTSDTLQLDFTTPLHVSAQGSERIYPNPSKGIFQIQSNKPILEVRLISLDGKEVWKKKSPGQRIDLSHLPKGIYVLKVETQEDIRESSLILN